ncbi:POTRA domain-containing protein [Cupriavidus sp. DL-D2]|uniref:POTRA domain-containing protein n=1 Tax=Cupriavidus sp. DL-D2 TaxID=3144974 RepID=UPI0032137C05
MAQVPLPSGQAAALTNAEQDQRNRQQREARERAAAVNAPTVRAEAIARAEWRSAGRSLGTSSAKWSTRKHGVSVVSAGYSRLARPLFLPMDPFAFARQWLEHYQGQCVGKQGVETLVKGLSQTILSKGYVTTRVLVPEQDLSSGTLKLALIPGVIGDIRFSDPDLWGTWKTAFPTAPGELLNLRDLEQGLEQMKRVASQDATPT